MPRVKIVRWHPLGKPLPAGWRIAQSRTVTCHHNHYSVLIERKRKEKKR